MTVVPDPGERFAASLAATPTAETIPWAPLSKPLAECRLALVTTGGVHLKSQTPFDLTTEGHDWSYREFPSTTPVSDLMVTHDHYNHEHVDRDINFMLPLDRFRELAAEGVIGELGPRCFTFYGYIRNPAALAATTAKEVAEKLREDAVDAVFLTPA
ncbi:MAG: glycine/sarcosine/betaine reductase selenoprotein B family protein [Dehalococcoidia bacterium]